ncbi:MAG: helix-turn-helix domain-containing protein [Chloroflexi bacterium]|nr:helix-turn-helix domain-containing protein [Chloroflexota bacterium]
MELGKRIRARRLEQDMSLRDLARQVDLTASFLSQVERGLVSPSIDSLRKISRALDVPVFYFLMEDVRPSPVVRRNERRKIILPTNVTYELLTPDVNRKMEVIMAELHPRDGSIPLVHYPHTEECIIVLDGVLEIGVGDQIYILEEGDAIYFEGAMLNHLAAKGDSALRYISIVTPPIF